MKKAAPDELYRIPAEYRDPKHPKHKAAMKLANTGKAIWSDQYDLVKKQDRVTNYSVLAKSQKYMQGGGQPLQYKSRREMRRAQARARAKAQAKAQRRVQPQKSVAEQIAENVGLEIKEGMPSEQGAKDQGGSNIRAEGREDQGQGALPESGQAT